MRSTIFCKSAIMRPERDGGTGEVTSKDCDKVSDSYLQENGIDAEEVKKEIVGKNEFKYGLYRNKKTGELYVYRRR